MRRLLPLLLLFLAPPARAELKASALGDAGELYTVRAGVWGELFPGDGSHAAATPVLVLEIAPGDGETDRLLVPGTEDARVESDPQLLYEQRSGSAILLWHSDSPEDGLRVEFATYGETGWSAVQPAVAGVERAPLSAVTRDSLSLELAEGAVVSTERSVVHLLYRSSGSTWYTPLVFVEGAHVGWLESLDLGAAYFAEPPAGEGPLAPALEQALSLQVADDEGAVVAAFADPASARLGALEIRLRPLAIELLGDLVRERIYALAELYDPDDVSNFAGEIRAEIIATGHHLRIHPGIAEFTGEQIEGWIETMAGDYGYGGFEDLGNDARELAIYLAGTVSGTLVEDPSNPGEEILEIELGEFLERLEGLSPLAEMLDVTVRSDRPAPAVGDGVAAIFPSRDGADLLVGWKAAGSTRIHYVESRAERDGGEWSAERTLTIGEGIDLLQAIELLQQKIR
jgi:hypothetical protein